MFDVGFSELMVIAVVALVVIGPERMPGFARTAGALFGRAQRYANQLKADIQNEVEMEEFNRIKATFYDAAKSVEQSVNQTKDEVDAAVASLNQSSVSPSQPAPAAATETQAVVAVEAPAHAAEHAPDTSAQQDFWLESSPTSAAAAAPAVVAKA